MYLLEPFGPELDLHQEVVGVHDRMDRVVHGDEVDTRVTGRVREPSVEEDGDVVIPAMEIRDEMSPRPRGKRLRLLTD